MFTNKKNLRSDPQGFYYSTLHNLKLTTIHIGSFLSMQIIFLGTIFAKVYIIPRPLEPSNLAWSMLNNLGLKKTNEKIYQIIWDRHTLNYPEPSRNLHLCKFIFIISAKNNMKKEKKNLIFSVIRIICFFFM